MRHGSSPAAPNLAFDSRGAERLDPRTGDSLSRGCSRAAEKGATIRLQLGGRRNRVVGEAEGPGHGSGVRASPTNDPLNTGMPCSSIHRS